ncbi:hypothetical protein F4781DRAFT_245023 [Annulohypoxylon bovei var. microspora]|nr:hypothetical protein F4781DRAFT_245023 [Annulohypoxylon bovei var. microspora]
MLSLASLLNPAPPGPPINRFPPSPASSSSPTTSLPDESGLLYEPIMAKQKIPKGTATLPTSRPKGVINFVPHQRLDEASLHQVRKFHVHPFGNIQEYSRHIPYASGKKDFFEKTGRESFEVFQYDFKVPGDEAEYTVMWDYNVGLVRMTPFFKCCKYPKTTPAKMLNLNPGLKEITHSITGGSIMAQGYWMPYYCAKAVCATFCHNIAGALIPIFGPDFPSLCTPSDAPEYSRMIIDPAIVVQATRDAEHFRRLYTNSITSSASGGGRFRSPYDDPRQRNPHFRRPLMRKPFATPTGCDSPYATDTDSDMSPVAPERGGTVHRDRFPYSPMAPPPPPPPPLAAPSHRPSSSGWTPANVVIPHHYDAPGPSPWLSAVPRFTTTAHLPPYPSPHPHSNPQPQPWRGGGKRSADHVEADYEYDNGRGRGTGGESSRTVTTTTIESNTKTPAPTYHDEDSRSKDKSTADPPAILGADKNAALLLMNLSVRDSRGNKDSGAGVTSETSSPRDGAFPRIKRIRANSM